MQIPHFEHRKSKSCVGGKERIENGTRLFIFTFVTHSQYISHKLGDNNPDSQNNLCKPTQRQLHLNLHKRTLMGWVSGEPFITRMQCVCHQVWDLQQTEFATAKTQSLQEKVQHAGQPHNRGPE